MDFSLACLIEEQCDSYEEFSKKIFNSRVEEDTIMGVIDNLKTVEIDSESKICKLKRVEELIEYEYKIKKAFNDFEKSGGRIAFFFNICWFYRWLLNEGYVYVFDDLCIEGVRKFIELLKIPEYVTERIKWAVVFNSFIEFNDADKDKICLQIMEHYSSEKGTKTYFDTADSWLIHHVLIRRKKWGTIKALEEKLLLNYISLIDSYPELENVFGVAIEKDMEFIHDQMKEKEANKR